MRTFMIGLIFAAGLSVPSAARAQTNLTLVPSASISAVTDDNIFSSARPSSDQTTLLSPSLGGSIETPRINVLGLYSFDMLRSASFAALNNIEARRHGMWDARFRETARTTLALNGHYDRSDDSGQLNFETGLLVPRRRAERWELTPSFAYQATPLVALRGQYDWVREELQYVMVANEQVARFGATRQWTSRTSFGLGYLGRHFVNGDETETSNAALFGWSYELDPFTMLSVQAGPRLSSRNRLEPEITASLGRRGSNLFGYGFDYWRGESIILGVQGPVELQSATGKISKSLRRNVGIGAGVGMFDSVTLASTEARDYHGEAVVTWSPWTYGTISASYGFDIQHGDIRTIFLAEQAVRRHVFILKFTAAPRLKHTIVPAGPAELLAPAPPSKGVPQ